MINDIWHRVERLAQRNLGKGVGGNSIDHEINLLMTLGQPKIVVDVGGHHGEWTKALLTRAPEARVVIVEPDSGNCAILRSAFTSRSVAVVEAALSDREGKATLFSNEPGSGLASLHQRDLSEHHLAHEAIAAVRTITWPTLRQLQSFSHVDLLKLDIEGHEYAVLSSMRDDLPDIRAIQFEFGGANVDSRTYLRDFWKLLSPAFSFHRISRRGLVPVPDYHEQDETFVTTNYVCVNKRMIAA